MCTTPLLIRNRKFKSLDVKLRSSYIQVPCGQCDECLSKRANDLYVRARYEFDYCLSVGGCGFMCCLTYEDWQLPYFEHLGKKYMVFNKKHVIDFIKRLRINLERFYKKNFNRSAPKFKYLITCEYGSDPTKTHRPHYHILIFFEEQVGLATFGKIFNDSRYVKGVPVFGRIYQCDPLDPARGGIKYSGKYILKDLMFETQRLAITNRIKFFTEYVNSMFNLTYSSSSIENEFRQKAIRRSVEYRKAICKYVRPYRHMLQFYMLSNDLGISAIIRKYGEGVVNMPFLNFDGFPFSLPKLVKKRVEQDYGSAKSDELSKCIFIEYCKRAFADLRNNFKISVEESDKLLYFAKKFIFPLSGSLYLVNPEGINIREHFEKGSSLVNYDDLIIDYEFFFDNNLFEYRNRLIHYLALYDDEDNRAFRSKLAARRKEENKANYEKKKRNNSYKYGNLL